VERQKAAFNYMLVAVGKARNDAEILHKSDAIYRSDMKYDTGLAVSVG
jgi:hypothetical protein